VEFYLTLLIKIFGNKMNLDHIFEDNKFLKYSKLEPITRREKVFFELGYFNGYVDCGNADAILPYPEDSIDEEVWKIRRKYFQDNVED